MIELTNGIKIKSYTMKERSGGIDYYSGITDEGKTYGFIEKDIAKTSADKVKPINDVYEWTLYKKDKKTIVRCETNPFASLGQIGTDSLVCTVLDYDKDEKVSRLRVHEGKHERGKIRIKPDYLSLDTTRGMK